MPLFSTIFHISYYPKIPGVCFAAAAANENRKLGTHFLFIPEHTNLKVNKEFKARRWKERVYNIYRRWKVGIEGTKRKGRLKMIGGWEPKCQKVHTKELLQTSLEVKMASGLQLRMTMTVRV
uniref:Uncharacterized protein n=1 Tax=Cacopsylla melanoneura TaxID=428564 RepID=A0A8D9EGG9_9HEMI